MTHEIVKAPDLTAIEKTLITGDLSGLTPDQRLAYYKSVCESLGLNPLTKPFAYISLNQKLTLYALKDCTEQLRKVHNVSVTIKAREVSDGCYVVTANAKLPNGREDESIGSVNIEGLKGEARSNAMMKSETKSKRRVTLSICGLGILDESEVDSIAGAKVFIDEKQIEHNVRTATANRLEDKTEGKAGDQMRRKEFDSPPSDDEIPGIKPVAEKVKHEDIICHIGKAEGQLLGKRVGDLHDNVLQWLVENWIPKLSDPPSDEKDLRLRNAVLWVWNERQKVPDPFKDRAGNVEGAPDVSRQRTAMEKPSGDDPGASGQAEEGIDGLTSVAHPGVKIITEKPIKVATGGPTINWREVAVDAPIKSNLQGRKLGTLSEGVLKAMKIEMIDKCDWSQPTLTQNTFLQAYRAACDELGVLFTRDELIERLRDRATDLILTENQFDKLLREQNFMDNNETLYDLREQSLRFLWSNWQTFKEVVEAERKPKAKEKKTKKG